MQCVRCKRDDRIKAITNYGIPCHRPAMEMLSSSTVQHKQVNVEYKFSFLRNFDWPLIIPYIFYFEGLLFNL